MGVGARVDIGVDRRRRGIRFDKRKSFRDFEKKCYEVNGRESYGDFERKGYGGVARKIETISPSLRQILPRNKGKNDDVISETNKGKLRFINN